MPTLTENEPDRVIIPAGDTSETVLLSNSYAGNTSGTFTVRILPSNEHLPHLTDNSATVQVKVPASQRWVTVSHRERVPHGDRGRERLPRGGLRAPRGARRGPGTLSAAHCSPR